MDDTFDALILQYGGSVLEAAIRLKGCDNAADFAEAMGHTRQVVEEALQPFRGRSYAHVRRSLEAQLGLTAYRLDALLPEVG